MVDVARSWFWDLAAVFQFGQASSRGLHQNSNCVCVWAQAVCVNVRAYAHRMCRRGCKYVCVHMRMCICMRGCMHLHMVHKCAKVISLTPRCGGPYPSPKMVSLRSSLCSFSVRNRTGGQPKEIAEVCISRQGTRNGRSICVCAQASLVHVHACAHLCVYFGVCMDVC